jgi:site-specific recombinase XerD
MRSTFKVLFFLKRDKQKTGGNVPLYCRITVDGKEARQLCYRRADKKHFSGYRIQAAHHSGIVRPAQQRTQIDDWRRYLQIPTRLYCLTCTRLTDFMQRYYSLSDVPLKEVDKKFISDFEAYLCANYNLALNTRIKQLKCLRHIFGIAYDEELIMRNPFSETGYFPKTDRGYLTQSEVETLINFRSRKKNEEDARNVFIFCCFTGLPYADVYNLTYDKIQQSFDGKMWIKGKRQKMKTDFQVLLLEIP